jgi:hypothetical protein
MRGELDVKASSDPDWRRSENAGRRGAFCSRIGEDSGGFGLHCGGLLSREFRAFLVQTAEDEIWPIHGKQFIGVFCRKERQKGNGRQRRRSDIERRMGVVRSCSVCPRREAHSRVSRNISGSSRGNTTLHFISRLPIPKVVVFECSRKIRWPEKNRPLQFGPDAGRGFSFFRARWRGCVVSPRYSALSSDGPRTVPE